MCRHDLREHKETNIVVERDAGGGWQRPYICIELLALLTLCRGAKVSIWLMNHCSTVGCTLCALLAW